MKRHIPLAAVLALAIALPAAAQFRKPEDAVKYRQSVMFVMSNNLYTRIGGMVNGRIPYDAHAAATSADTVVFLSRLPWDAFIPGTENVGRTDAKPGIWTEPAKFKDLQEKMQSEVLKLAQVTKTGDLEALKVAYRATTAACKNCHDSYTSQ
ncbi:MAG TPA: cytochrome c [Ramlibacter sp.]|uniref:c-type cytochrome n=1 Tax=Ramlibacter sp. TaxID=1917967 RepID=UPI002C2B9AE2|nr:cytochrome c [Ramlibacter sp.]HVZ46774.1 cytochrome c [Ramlibacter sp.]